MSKMSFEELFRKHLSDYKEVPRADVWMRLSQRLEAKKRRRRLAWWMSSAALVAGLTAFTLWLRYDSSEFQISDNKKTQSSVPQSENPTWDKTPPLNIRTSGTDEKKENTSVSIQMPVYQKNILTSTTKRKHFNQFNPAIIAPAQKISEVNIHKEPSSVDQSINNLPTVISESPSSTIPSEANSSQSGNIKADKNYPDVTDVSGTSESHTLEDPEAQQHEKCARQLPLFIGLSYEAGSLWRLNPFSATPGLWMPADNVETLPGSKGAKATSFSDVVQAIHFTAGYRFSDVLSVHLSLGHTRVRHFESGNLLNRALPPSGELGLMTGTGAFKVGSEAVSDTSIVLRKLAQQFSYVTLTPGITYNLNLKQWVLGFNAGMQLHLLVSNRAEATFAHTTHAYRHDGLRSFNAAFNAGFSVGYRIHRLMLSVGFQGGYWLTPLSRQGFAGARYLQMGIRPSVIYNF